MHRNKSKLIIALLMVMFLASCIPFMQGETPWWETIPNWTSKQKANFFMETWRAEHQSYKSMNAIPDKSPALIEFLKDKQKILEASRVPVRTYVTYVNAGNKPDAATEDEIINWLRDLQLKTLK